MNKRTRRRPEARGFTLIEILIVNGILGLMLASIVILVIFKAKTHSLIPLYAVGVFGATMALKKTMAPVHTARATR